MNLLFDTNVLVSAIGWSGPPAEAVAACLDIDHFTILTTEPLLRELAKVLDYPKLSKHISNEQKFIILSGLTKAARLVNPEEVVDIITADPADNRLLECALAGEADYLITGDSHLLELGYFGKTKIVTPERFLSEIRR